MVELRKLKKGSLFSFVENGPVYVKDRFLSSPDNTYLVRDLRGVIFGKLGCHELVFKV